LFWRKKARGFQASGSMEKQSRDSWAEAADYLYGAGQEQERGDDNTDSKLSPKKNNPFSLLNNERMYVRVQSNSSL